MNGKQVYYINQSCSIVSEQSGIFIYDVYSLIIACFSFKLGVHKLLVYNYSNCVFLTPTYKVCVMLTLPTNPQISEIIGNLNAGINLKWNPLIFS